MKEKNIVNAVCGIDSIQQPERWYRWYRFPLLPIFKYRKADYHNTASYSFSWLNLRFWTLDTPDIGIALKIEDVGGWVSIYLPFCKIVIWLFYLPWKMHQKLWRRAQCHKDNQELK